MIVYLMMWYVLIDCLMHHHIHACIICTFSLLRIGWLLHYFADPAPGPSTSRWASQALGLGYLLHIAQFLILVHAFWPSALHCFTVHVLYGLRPSYCFTGFDYSGFIQLPHWFWNETLLLAFSLKGFSPCIRFSFRKPGTGVWHLNRGVTSRGSISTFSMS